MSMNNTGPSSESAGGLSAGVSPSLNAIPRSGELNQKKQKYQKRVEKILNRLNDM